MTNQEENRLFELQVLSQEIQNIQTQLNSAVSGLNEMQILRNTLEELKKIDENTEIIIPLSHGIFTKGKITKGEELFNLVGSNIVVEKNINETKESINAQIKETSKIKEKLERELSAKIEKIQKIQNRE